MKSLFPFFKLDFLRFCKEGGRQTLIWFQVPMPVTLVTFWRLSVAKIAKAKTDGPHYKLMGKAISPQRRIWSECSLEDQTRAQINSLSGNAPPVQQKQGSSRPRGEHYTEPSHLEVVDHKRNNPPAEPGRATA